MLAILFVATRMCALQITQQQGGQRCRSPSKRWANVFENQIGVWSVTIIKRLGLPLHYGGVVTVITLIFLIPPTAS